MEAFWNDFDTSTSDKMNAFWNDLEVNTGLSVDLGIEPLGQDEIENIPDDEQRMRALEMIKAVICLKHANKDSIRAEQWISDYEYLVLDEVGWRCESRDGE